MKPTPIVATLVLAIGGVAAALALAPQASEQMAILVRDGQYETAGAFSQDLDRKAEGDPMLLADLFHLDMQIGDADRARATIEDYLRARPDDLAMLRKAAEFFRSVQDVEAYIRLEERIVAQMRAPSDIETLAGIYRSNARFADERRILSTYRDAGLSPAALGRLGNLLARSGDYTGAVAPLEAAVAAGGEQAGPYRQALFDSLMAQGAAERAAALAGEWTLAGLVPPAVQAVMVMTLANSGNRPLAERLAALVAPSERRDPSALVWALSEHRRFDLARAALRGWFDDADDATLAKGASLYVEATAAAGTLAEMTADLQAALLRKDDTAARSAIAIAAAAYARWGYDVIAPLRHLMSAERMLMQPLFAASLSIEEENQPASRYFLLKADLSQYDEAQAGAWSAMAQTVFSQSEIASELIARWRAGRLSPTLYPLLQTTAAATGSTSLAFDLFGENAPSADKEAGL